MEQNLELLEAAETWDNGKPICESVRGGMFSLDNGRERRVLTRSNVCTIPEQP
jgi:uncharacterized protein (DUF779 family)